MLGQYRIVSEILLFAVGLAIASFVAVTFDDLQVSLANTAARDQMASVSNLISTSVIKSMTENATIRLQIPERVSNEVYTISFERAAGGACSIGNCVLRLRTLESGIATTQELFNISQSHIITGSVYSSARYVEIRSNRSTITIERG